MAFDGRDIVGDSVICDGACGRDLTESDEEGGIMFGSKAMCPQCAPRVEAGARRHGEEHAINARCPPGMTFAHGVRTELRGKEPG
jgi:hypothetical protein